MFIFRVLLLIIFSIAHAQEVRMSGLKPKLSKCFIRFTREIIEPNYPRRLDITGALFSVNPENGSYPVHVIAYLYDVLSSQKYQGIAFYMQFGECADDTQTVFRVNNSDPYSFLKIPRNVMNFLVRACTYYSDNNDNLVTEVHAFGNGRVGIDYQEAFNNISMTINALPAWCYIYSTQDTRDCVNEGCIGYCSNDQDDDSSQCSREFVQTYQGNDNNMSNLIWIPVGLALGACYYLLVKRFSNICMVRNADRSPRRRQAAYLAQI